MKCREGPLRVLVVDDDPVFRHILVHTLSQLPQAKVAATAPNIAEAKRRLNNGNVDIVLLDVVLGEESGLDLLKWVNAEHKDVLVVLLTAGGERRASQTIDAILLGAFTLILKPSGPNAPRILRDSLSRVLSSVCPAPGTSAIAAPPAPRPDPLALMPREREIIVVGASTGGPPVLLQLLQSLPISFEVPVLITQHMLPEHLAQFTNMLRFVDHRQVSLAEQGVALSSRGVYIAPPHKHLGVQRTDGKLCTRLLEGPPENFVQPAVDPMFRSAAEICGRGAVGVVLTGMGSDGAKGALALQAQGAPIVVQDESTSVVWAMPGATVAAGAASQVVPANDVAAAIVHLTVGRALGKVERKR